MMLLYNRRRTRRCWEKLNVDAGGKNWWMGGPLLHWRVWQLLKETEGLLQVRGKFKTKTNKEQTKTVGSQKSAEVKKRNSDPVTCLLQENVQWHYYILHQQKKKKLRIFHAPPGGWLQCSRQSKIISQHYRGPGGSQVCVFFEAGPTQKQNFKDFSR